MPAILSRTVLGARTPGCRRHRAENAGMEIHGFEVEARAPAPGGEPTEFGRWCAERFGVVPALAVLVPSMDDALVALPGLRESAPAGDDAGRVATIEAGGVVLEVVEPEPPGTSERRIGEFIDAAADLEGASTDELAARVERIVAGAWDEIDRALAGVAHDKVLATMLLVSQRSRAAGAPTDSPDYWQRSAASTLLSGFVGRGASG
jgi:hypothetical protein